MNLVDVGKLREIAEVEFADIVAEAFVPDVNELRILLTDGSFVDVWFSLKLSGRYGYHWERRGIDGKCFRESDQQSSRRSTARVSDLCAGEDEYSIQWFSMILHHRIIFHPCFN